MRRLLLIIAVLIVLAGIGAWAYITYISPKVTVGTPSGTDELPISGNVPTTSGTNGEPVTIQPEKVGSRLTQIDKNPVAPGEAVFTVGTSSTADIGVSFVERESGNLFNYLVHAGTLTRTSNKTIPGVEEAVWLPNGSLVFLRYLSGDSHTLINTYALPSSGQGGYFLAQNISDISLSGASVLALASGANGSVGTLERLDGSQAKQVFTSPLAMLRSSFAGKTQYLAFTKPSATLVGYAFLINSSGNFERVAGPLQGLVALASPSGKWALLSYVKEGAMQTSLLNIGTHELIALPVATIADKCAWTLKEDALFCAVPLNPTAGYNYPDDWYQGAATFSDRLWKLDVAGRFAELVLDFPKETKTILDATSLAVDPTAQVLVFRNKNDGSLWSYEL